MEKHKKRIITVLLVIIIMPIFSSGSDSPIETTDTQMISYLLLERTRIMQKGMYNTKYRADLFTHLQKIEEQPLLKEDVAKVEAYIDTDFDAVSSMQILEIYLIAKNMNTYTFGVRVKWFMAGQNGSYTEECKYIVNAQKFQEQFKLSAIYQ